MYYIDDVSVVDLGKRVCQLYEAERRRPVVQRKDVVKLTLDRSRRHRRVPAFDDWIYVNAR